jgi:hypothetical protein
VAYGDSQAQCLLADGAGRPLHCFRDFGHWRLALRVRLEIANVFLRPSDTLSSTVVLSTNSHQILLFEIANYYHIAMS